MSHLDRILEITALGASLLALAGVLSTDAYSHAAQAEASGYDALAHLIANDANAQHMNGATAAVPAASTSRIAAQ